MGEMGQNPKQEFCYCREDAEPFLVQTAVLSTTQGNAPSCE